MGCPSPCRPGRALGASSSHERGAQPHYGTIFILPRAAEAPRSESRRRLIEWQDVSQGLSPAARFRPISTARATSGAGLMTQHARGHASLERAFFSLSLSLFLSSALFRAAHTPLAGLVEPSSTSAASAAALESESEINGGSGSAREGRVVILVKVY